MEIKRKLHCFRFVEDYPYLQIYAIVVKANERSQSRTNPQHVKMLSNVS